MSFQTIKDQFQLMEVFLNLIKRKKIIKVHKRIHKNNNNLLIKMKKIKNKKLSYV